MSSPLWAEARFMSRCTHPGCNTPIRKGLRKCVAHKKTKGKVTQGRPVRKGANAVGIAAHKPDKSRTRKAKRQNPEVMGTRPQPMRAVRMNPARADRKPNEEIW